VGRGGPDERRRAQLVLAQVPDVPARLLAPLLESDDPAAWLFARLRSCGADELERLDREATERLDRSLGTATAEDPVAVVAEEVRRRLGPDEGRLLGRVPPPMKRWWDLDGDERREMALFSLRSLGSRKGLAAAAVVGRPAADAPWSIRWFRPFEDSDVDGELLVTDLDGDGREEALLRWEIVAGWCWGCALVLTGPESLERPLELTSSGSPRLRVFLVQRSPAAAPFLVTWGGHRETNGGKAVVYSGLLAWEARMHALRRGRLEAAGSVFLPTMKLDAPKDSIGNPSARGERRAAAPGG
jgi:hypothetical protein